MASVLRHWPFLRHRLGRVLALLIVTAAFFTGSPPLRGQDPDLAQIAEHLKRWRSSFVNVRVVWESWGTKDLKSKGAARPSADDTFSRNEWVWADIGAFRNENWFYREGRLAGHDAHGTNGPKLLHFLASYNKPGEPGFLTRVQMARMQSSLPASSFVITPVMDLYDPGDCTWLGDRLARGKGQLEKYEDVDGVRCARVPIEDRVCFNILWLDPGHDFLIRRIRPDPQKPEAGFIYDAGEFQRVGSIWFPKRGTLGRHGDKPSDLVRWLVTEVAINLLLDAKFFDPPAPQIGTVVVEPSGRGYTFGEKRPGEAREGQIAEEAQKNLSAAGQPVSAEAPVPGAIRWSERLLLVSVALLLFGIGALFWRRWG